MELTSPHGPTEHEPSSNPAAPPTSTIKRIAKKAVRVLKSFDHALDAAKVWLIADEIFNAAAKTAESTISAGAKYEKATLGITDALITLSFYKNIQTLRNAFSRETLDETALQETLHAALCDSSKHGIDIKAQAKLAAKVFEKVMRQNAFNSKEEVHHAISQAIVKLSAKRKDGLIKYDLETARKIADLVTIQKKERSIVEVISVVCLTISDTIGTVTIFDNWNIIDLTQIAQSIGGQSKVFMFFAEVGSFTFMGIFTSAGLLLSAGKLAHEAVTIALKMSKTENIEEKEKLRRELIHSLTELLMTGVDFAYSIAPVAFALSPPAILALAIIAKGTCVCVFFGQKYMDANMVKSISQIHFDKIRMTSLTEHAEAKKRRLADISKPQETRFEKAKRMKKIKRTGNKDLFPKPKFSKSPLKAARFRDFRKLERGRGA